jgi:hypothetical protein
MNMLIIFGIAAGCVLAERLWPAMELPRVNAWWGRVILINSIQLGITLLAGQTWNRWLNHVSIFCLRAHFGDWSSAAIIYFFSCSSVMFIHPVLKSSHPCISCRRASAAPKDGHAPLRAKRLLGGIL